MKIVLHSRIRSIQKDYEQKGTQSQQSSETFNLNVDKDLIAARITRLNYCVRLKSRIDVRRTEALSGYALISLETTLLWMSQNEYIL